MTDNSKKIFAYLKANDGTEITAQKIAADLGVSISAVTGSVNGLVKKGYAVRNVVSTLEGEKEVVTKYIALTSEGLAFDPIADENRKAAEAEAKKAEKAAAKAAKAAAAE